jgi:AcrR family transcriptional regulator
MRLFLRSFILLCYIQIVFLILFYVPVSILKAIIPAFAGESGIVARKRRPNDMREKILLVAESLIIEKGYRSTSLDEVVEKAGCSKSAVYEYFGGKEGLLSALSVDLVTTLSRELEALSHTTDDVTGALESYAVRAMSLILTERHISDTPIIAWDPRWPRNALPTTYSGRRTPDSWTSKMRARPRCTSTD